MGSSLNRATGGTPSITNIAPSVLTAGGLPVGASPLAGGLSNAGSALTVESSGAGAPEAGLTTTLTNGVGGLVPRSAGSSPVNAVGGVLGIGADLSNAATNPVQSATQNTPLNPLTALSSNAMNGNLANAAGQVSNGGVSGLPAVVGTPVGVATGAGAGAGYTLSGLGENAATLGLPSGLPGIPIPNGVASALGAIPSVAGLTSLPTNLVNTLVQILQTVTNPQQALGSALTAILLYQMSEDPTSLLSSGPAHAQKRETEEADLSKRDNVNLGWGGANNLPVLSNLGMLPLMNPQLEPLATLNSTEAISDAVSSISKSDFDFVNSLPLPSSASGLLNQLIGLVGILVQLLVHVSSIQACASLVLVKVLGLGIPVPSFT